MGAYCSLCGVELHVPSPGKSPLRPPSRACEANLGTEAVWLRRPSGYGNRLVTEAVWLRRPSGHGDRLVTEAENTEIHKHIRIINKHIQKT